MKKVLKFGEKEYTAKSSAFTLYAYKNDFDSDYMTDLQKVIDLSTKGSDKSNLTVVSELFDIIYKMAYVMIKESDESQVNDYDSFLKSLDTFPNDIIEDIIKLAINPFAGQVKINK